MVRRFRPHIGRTQLRASVSQKTRDATMSGRAGMAQVIKNYEAWIEHLGEEMPEVLADALKPAFDLSQVYCPKDTGKLAASGYLEAGTFRGKPVVNMGYGKGGDPDYAAVVHENMEWKHKAPTKAKYLEDALKEEESEIQARLIVGLKKAGGF